MSGFTIRVWALPPHRKANGTAHSAKVLCVATAPTERTEIFMTMLLLDA